MFTGIFPIEAEIAKILFYSLFPLGGTAFATMIFSRWRGETEILEEEELSPLEEGKPNPGLRSQQINSKANSVQQEVKLPFSIKDFERSLQTKEVPKQNHSSESLIPKDHVIEDHLLFGNKQDYDFCLLNPYRETQEITKPKQEKSPSKKVDSPVFEFVQQEIEIELDKDYRIPSSLGKKIKIPAGTKVKINIKGVPPLPKPKPTPQQKTPPKKKTQREFISPPYEIEDDDPLLREAKELLKNGD